jgi:2-C-methyl-D-erythritol 4-phosphate cytidylyltransferase
MMSVVNQLQPPALGVVPVIQDDRGAPAGCAALRPLRAIELVRRAVDALLGSAMVGAVLVPVPPALITRVEELLGGLPGRARIQVIAEQENGPGARVLAALRARPPASDAIVVVHDPLHPLVASALVSSVVSALIDRSAGAGGDRDGCVAVLSVRSVTDTLKWVDEDDVVTATADREGFRTVCGPQAFRASALLAALSSAPKEVLRARGAEVLPLLVADGGRRLCTVPAPGEVFRIASADDLVLAEAMVAAGSRSDDEAALR